MDDIEGKEETGKGIQLRLVGGDLGDVKVRGCCGTMVAGAGERAKGEVAGGRSAVEHLLPKRPRLSPVPQMAAP